MSQRTTSSVKRKGRRKTLLYVASATIGVAALLYFEYVALLYVIGTLALTALLVVVAFADLERAKEIRGSSSPPAADAASMGSDGALPEASPTPTAAPPRRKLRREES